MADITGPDTGDTVSLTYAELGDARGISAASAKRLAIRRHWRRSPGNERSVRVMVPVTEATPSPKVRPIPETSRQAVTGDGTGDISSLVAALQAANEARIEDAGRIARLEEQLRQAEGVRDAALEAANRADAEAAAARDRLADMERDNDARRSLGRWARLRDAWRGRG